ncbi:MAG: STAS domain-containing protein [Pseudomonadales bacterium]|nr:STAS domain-containing protein [Pseudomonadales bacterium]
MNSGKILAADFDGVPVLKFVGDVRVVMSATLDRYFSALLDKSDLEAVLVDMSETTGIDSTALGLLAKMAIQVRKKFSIKPTIVSPNSDISRILSSMGFDMISKVVSDPLTRVTQFGELEFIDESEERIRLKVIQAHQTLMSLNDKNRLQFQDLVNALQKEK